jgi:hypothetical protein
MTWPRLFVGRQDGGSIYLIDLCQTVSLSLDPLLCWRPMPILHRLTCPNASHSLSQVEVMRRLSFKPVMDVRSQTVMTPQ